MANSEELDTPLFERFFGPQQPGPRVPEDLQRTPVSLPDRKALRMRCVELVLETVDKGTRVNWEGILERARELEDFVNDGS